MIDKYQGEENKIVILTLVRSNGPQIANTPLVKPSPLGFVKIGASSWFFVMSELRDT